VSSTIAQTDIARSDNAGKDPVARLVQITDCHLGPEEGYALAGIHTNKSLRAVLQALAEEQAEEQLSQASPLPVHLMVTGDIAAHGSPGAYDAFLEHIKGWQFNWLPGNHDDFPLMQAIAPRVFEPVFGAANWRLISLNSAVPNRVAGNLPEDQLDGLISALRQYSENPVALFMHHPPADIGCRWLDRQQIANGDALAEIIGECNNIKAIFTGHVHQAVETDFSGVPLLTTPSTCFQFAPKQNDFGLDVLPPGYRRINLYGDGSFDTQVVYLSDYPESVDVGIQGY